ncbi:hypothetical protein ACFX13_008665 [Malus domestica]
MSQRQRRLILGEPELLPARLAILFVADATRAVSLEVEILAVGVSLAPPAATLDTVLFGEVGLSVVNSALQRPPGTVSSKPSTSSGFETNCRSWRSVLANFSIRKFWFIVRSQMDFNLLHSST